MVASPFPSLSQIRAWDTEHLRDAATAWRRTADQWQESFRQLASHMPAPGGTPWEGAASEAAQLRASSDAIKVGEIGVSVQIASTAAANGADDIDAIRRSALRAIDNAESAGFTVGRICRLPISIPASPPWQRWPDRRKLRHWPHTSDDFVERINETPELLRYARGTVEVDPVLLHMESDDQLLNRLFKRLQSIRAG
jgi:hypothetical protein